MRVDTQKRFLAALDVAMQHDSGLSVFRAINIAANAICPTIMSRKETNFSDIVFALEKYNKVRGRYKKT